MTQVETSSKIKIDIKEPPKFKIIYINDEVTSLDFVINSLAEHFGYTTQAAQELAINIHEIGSAVVAVMPYEIAEQKGIEITVSARSQGFPLQIRLEPDTH
jgi:ATP-dependent Clp protease adaptor protein ClpS